jgi:hypothetical protein
MDWTEIITALIAAIGAVGGSAMIQSKSTAILQAKLEALKEDVATLSKRVDRHNGVVSRTAVLEAKVDELERKG